MPHSPGENLADMMGGHSNTDIAAAVGVAKQTVSNWRRNRDSPKPENVPPLARALGRPEEEVDLAVARAKREKSELADLQKEVKALRAEVQEMAASWSSFRASLETRESESKPTNSGSGNGT